MPTAAKLVAAILWGLIAVAASLLARPLFPEGASLRTFALVNGGLGLAVGWLVAGRRTGTTVAGAMSNGITASVALAVLALGAQSAGIMLRQAWRRVYDGPTEALGDVLALMGRNAHFLLAPGVGGTLLAGGILAGLLTEWAARRWT